MAEGSTTLRFLGAGGAFSRRYGTTCSLVTLPNGERWLIDCGRQAPDQLWDVGLEWHQIAGQLVTHVHGDHIFGLEDFGFQRYYQSAAGVPPVMLGGPRPKLIAHSAVQGEIWETLAASMRYLKIDGNPRAGTLASYFEIIDPSSWEPPAQNPWRHSETFAFSDARVIARENEHVPGKPSCSFEFHVGGPGEPDKIAWWSGDSTVDAAFLASIEPRTTIYFHDCTFVDYPGQVHGAFSLLEKLPEEIRRKMVLMHHEDDIERHRTQVEALGFRVGMPGQVYDLCTGKLISEG
ncbi:MAG: MBL fold metallo-hydrolase [Myxococcales bacterium]|nr:MBL fold metallo-hydrolase [Myxococcales bacterium]